MNFKTIVAITLAFAMSVTLMVSCRIRDSNVLNTLGLRESVLGRPQVLEAIRLANSVLKNRKSLTASWSTDSGTESFPLYIVQPTGLPLQTIAQLEPEHQIVLVSSNWLESLKSMFGSDSLIEANKTAVLALILLHELGHAEGEAIQADTTFDFDSLALLSREKMIEELKADAYAIRSIRECACEEGTIMIAALAILDNAIAFEYDWKYGLHGGPLSWMSRDLKKQYGDHNLTHPNLNFRFRLMSYVLEPSLEKKEAIEWILRMREARKNYPTPGGIEYLHPVDSTGELEQ